MNTKKILIIEDDSHLASQIAHFLESWKYETAFPESFDDLDEQAERIKPDLILMDITLPVYDGYYWTSQIRKNSNVPILFISSRTTDQDIIMAIVQGGDDYVTKPFGLELLKAKIDALLRRAVLADKIREIDLGQNLIYVPDQSLIKNASSNVELTSSEKKIMDQLSSKRSITVSREDLMMALWQTDEFISDGSLTTCISRLRSKLKAVFGTPLIETRKGIGYILP